MFLSAPNPLPPDLQTAISTLEEIRLLRGEMDALRADLAATRIELAARAAKGLVNGGGGNGGNGGSVNVGANGTSTTTPRITPYTVSEFAALVRRSKRYVATCCRANEIRALPGKPYLIPVSELNHFLDTRGGKRR